MATGSSVIAALRSGASGAPPTSAKSGVEFFDPTTGTTSPIDEVIGPGELFRGGMSWLPATTNTKVESTVDALRKNNRYALSDPALLTMRAGVVGGNKPKPKPAPKVTTPVAAPVAAPVTQPAVINDGLFTKGQSLNDMYGAAFRQETSMDMPDMRLHGGRYEGEIASTKGRTNLADAITLRDQNVGVGEIYKAGDFDLLPGMDMVTPEGRSAFNQYMGGGENNSMFIPDMVEVDPGYWVHSPQMQGLSEEDRNTNWERSYYGGNMLMHGNAADIRSPEWQLRDLMRGTYRAESGNANLFGPGQTANEVVNNLYADARAPVIAMDVGRGGLTPDQADAVNRATEYSTYLRRLGPEMDATANARALYEGELSKYMDTVNTIDQSKTDLSSLALINALRGVENPALAGITPGPARVLPDAPITFDQAFKEINSSAVISGSQADPEVRAAVLKRVNESISNPAARENLISDIEQITGQTADQLGLTSSVVTTQPIEAPEAKLSNQMNDLQRQINSFRYENYGSYDEAVNARNAMERQLGTIQRQLMADGFFFDENTGTWVKR